jgi:hypothetical protein
VGRKVQNVVNQCYRQSFFVGKNIVENFIDTCTFRLPLDVGCVAEKPLFQQNVGRQLHTEYLRTE